MMQANRRLRKALADNSTAADFTAKSPTVTEPTGNGVFNLTKFVGGSVPMYAMIWPFGSDADAETFDMRLWGWWRITGDGQNSDLWIPSILAGLSVVLSTPVGVAGAEVLNTDFFADTITITSGMEPVITADTTNQGTIVRQSNAGNQIAWAKVPLCGPEKIEFDFDRGTAASANCLWTLL